MKKSGAAILLLVLAYFSNLQMVQIANAGSIFCQDKADKFDQKFTAMIRPLRDLKLKYNDEARKELYKCRFEAKRVHEAKKEMPNIKRNITTNQSLTGYVMAQLIAGNMSKGLNSDRRSNTLMTIKRDLQDQANQLSTIATEIDSKCAEKLRSYISESKKKLKEYIKENLQKNKSNHDKSNRENIFHDYDILHKKVPRKILETNAAGKSFYTCNLNMLNIVQNALIDNKK